MARWQRMEQAHDSRTAQRHAQRHATLGTMDDQARHPHHAQPHAQPRHAGTRTISPRAPSAAAPKGICPGRAARGPGHKSLFYGTKFQLSQFSKIAGRNFSFR